MSKILFTDFDETLLCTDKTVTKENREALMKLLDAGHYVAFTTGRPLHGARYLFEQLNIPPKHCFLICFQGCFTYDIEHEKVVVTNPMDAEDMIKLVAELRERNIYIEAFGKDRFYCFEYTKATERYNGITNEPFQVIEDIETLRREPIYKVMAIDFDNMEPLNELQKMATQDSDFPFESFFSSPWFYEFCGKNQNKGAGLANLAAYLGIPIQDTVAVGDEENDVSMIERAGVGVAMCNARAEIKEHADEITTRDNNHSGVAEVIYRFLLSETE